MGAAIAIVAVLGLLVVAGSGGGSKIHTGGWRVDAQCKQATVVNFSEMFISLSGYALAEGWLEMPTTDRQEVSDRAAGYFASLFPQCKGTHPETLKENGSVMTWDEWLDSGLGSIEGAAASVSSLRAAAQKVAGR